MQRGTGAAVNAVGKPLAGKTGTTSDWRDAWFVGFSPDLAAGVFIGYDDPDLGVGEQAARLAAPIFRDFMMAALKDEPATEFRIPPGMRMFRVNPDTGLPAGRRRARGLRGLQARHRPGKDRDLGLHGVPGEAGTDLSVQRHRPRRVGKVASTPGRRHWRSFTDPPLRKSTDVSMRAEMQAVADDIKKSLALLRRHL